MNSELLLRHFDRISEAPDAVARLRRFILDLAVRGKLVEQDPGDEPATELLNRIQAAKGKRAGALPPIGEDELEFDLPRGWAAARFGDVFSLEYGDNLPAEKRSNTGEYPVYGSNGVVGSHFECFVNSPCIVVGRKGSAGALNLSLTDGCCVTDVAYYCIPPVGLDLNFSYKLFHTLGLATLGKGVKPGLNRSEAYVLPLAIPPLAEQHRIVAKVDELMGLCDQLEAVRSEREARRDRLVAASLHRIVTAPAEGAAPDEAQTSTALRQAAHFHLEHLPRLTTRPEYIRQLRQTILDLAVHGRLVSKDPSDEPASELLKRITLITGRQADIGIEQEDQRVFEPPPGWAWSRVGLITTKTGSGSTPRGGQAAYQPTGIPFLRSQNVYNDGLRLNDVAYIDQNTHRKMSGTAVQPGDLLLNITGGSIGRCCLIPEGEIEANISQHVAIIRLANAGTRAFIHRVILSPFFQSFVVDEQTGAGRGGLPKNRMDQIPVPVPPLAEQHRIVAKVDELMALCDQLEAQLTTSEADSRRLLEAVLRDALAA
jgi:type I restriction enzyme S subunit